MRIFLLSVYFYLSNLYFDAISAFSFAPNFFEFFTIFLAIFFINSYRLAKPILFFWAFLYYCAFCYIRFAGHIPNPFEISLFWSHFDETFESFRTLLHLFISPFIFFCGAILLIFWQKPTQANFKIFAILVVVLSLIPFDFADSSLNMLKNMANSFTHDTPQISNSTQQKPITTPKSKQFIVIIGESLRSDKLSLFGNHPKFSPNLDKIKSDLFYSKIYANGTNTDVALPLFFNGTQNLHDINLGNNLFTLAKDAGFQTHFISSQTQNYLKYIMPYIGNVAKTTILDTKNDLDLPKQLEQINLKQNNFVVFQMIGTHSPYKFYSSKFAKFPNDYDNCVLQSDFVMSKIFEFAIKNNIPTIYFSDHGELLGEVDGFYGHNRFSEAVYLVPFLSYGIENPAKIKSQNDIFEILKTNLGYQKEPKFSKIIRVNGSMITGEDGFREFKR
jgi:glucan phosphoethanolaminetransferase (alkaline phosphatase superfamily)